MPTIPKQDKMFFCRVTTDPINIPDTPIIKTKIYTHPFDHFYYVHEKGMKTEKPHYHLLIVCKTTKIEIAKWIKATFNVSGNEQYSVSDKYDVSSMRESLTYMLKGGLNVIIGNREIDNIEELKNNYKKVIEQKKQGIDHKFEHYYNIILDHLKTQYNKYKFTGYQEYLDELDHQELFKIIYDVLIRNAIQRRTLFRKNIIGEHAFVYCCHFANNKQLCTILDEVKERECEKMFKTLD